MPRYDKLGKIILKFPMMRTLSVDGLETVLTLKMIPPYVQPTAWWASFDIVGDGSGINPAGHMPYRLRGAAGSVDTRATLQESSTDVTMVQNWARYATESESEAMVPDDVISDSPDVGIIGDSQRIQRKKINFLTQKKVLGLPGNAVFTNSDLILYTDSFSRKGRFTTKDFEITDAKFIGFAARADAITTMTDEGLIQWSNEADFQALYEEIIGAMPTFSTRSDVGGSGGLDATVLTWMQEGFVSATHSLEQGLTVYGSFTCVCNVFMPQSARIITVA